MRAAVYHPSGEVCVSITLINDLPIMLNYRGFGSKYEINAIIILYLAFIIWLFLLMAWENSKFDT